MKQNIQISFDWHLTNNCNFNCIYCHPQIKAVLNKNQKINYSFEQILNAFENINKTCHIYMSGGEPFLFPNFIEFCKKITKKHYISINTNLSIPQIVQFVESINPKHVVGIYAALHILERERLNIPVKKFISDVLMLQQKGFNITVFYVLYPPLIDRFSEDAKILRDSGIKYVAGKIFKGVYKGKLYPDNYSSDEKRKINSFNNDYKLSKSYLEGDVHFEGMQCYAGKKFFKVEVDGRVRRCASTSDNLGNLYEGTFVSNVHAEPCTAKRALCISHCHKYLVNYEKNKSENT